MGTFEDTVPIFLGSNYASALPTLRAKEYDENWTQVGPEIGSSSFVDRGGGKFSLTKNFTVADGSRHFIEPYLSTATSNTFPFSIITPPASGSSGGSIDIGEIVAALGGQAVTVSAPVDPDDENRLTLVQGDDHLEGDRLPTWIIENYAGPDLTGATAKLRLLSNGVYANPRGATGAEFAFDTDIAIDGATITFTTPLTSTQTGNLTSGVVNETYRYQIVATTIDGDVITPIIGVVDVIKKIEHPSS